MLRLIVQTTVMVLLNLLVLTETKPTPVVIWHGMGDSCCNPLSMGRIKKLIQYNGPSGIYVKNLMLGSNVFEDTEHGYFANMNDLVQNACEQVNEDEELKNGYYALGFSQGGLFVRALAQRCSWPPVKGIVSIGGPQQGVYGFPYCLGEKGICETVRRLLNLGSYLNFVQNHLVQAQYWHDPYKNDEYNKRSIFLADINCARACNKTQYHTNIARLNFMVLLKFTKDKMVVPKDSEWFGNFLENNSTYVVPMRETTLYIDDLIGLRTLDENKRLHFLSVDGNHLQISEKYFLNNIVKKYFMS